MQIVPVGIMTFLCQYFGGFMDFVFQNKCHIFFTESEAFITENCIHL